MIQTTAQNLDDSNAVNIEILGRRWHNGQSGFCDELRQEFLGTWLLGCKGGRNGGRKFRLSWQNAVIQVL